MTELEKLTIKATDLYHLYWYAKQGDGDLEITTADLMVAYRELLTACQNLISEAHLKEAKNKVEATQ